jgi:hypothetical protein
VEACPARGHPPEGPHRCSWTSAPTRPRTSGRWCRPARASPRCCWAPRTCGRRPAGAQAAQAARRPAGPRPRHSRRPPAACVQPSRARDRAPQEAAGPAPRRKPAP